MQFAGLSGDLIVNEGDKQFVKNQVADSDRIYHFEYLSDLSDPERKVQQWLEELGYEQERIYNYRGVGFVYLYQKSNIKNQI